MSNVEQDNAPTALYLHCVSTYNQMLLTAQVRTTSEPGKDSAEAREVVVWEGMLTSLITGELNLSIPYYTSVTRALKRMGCIRQLRRGGGTSPSQWELIRDPTPELFEKAEPRKEKRTDKYSLMQEQLTSMNRRLLKLEVALANIIEEEE